MRTAALPAHLSRWPRTAFPTALGPATDALRGHLQGRIDADGAVRDQCHSRVLESALLLALLDRTRSEPATRRHLAAFLAAGRESPDPLNRLLARAALHDRPDVTDLLDVDRFLGEAPDFTGPRKRALLDAVLLLLGTSPGPPSPAPAAAFSPRGLHSWALVQVAAVKAVLAHAHGYSPLIDDRDLDLLRSTQQPGRVWEGNLLIHLFVLHALALLPGHQRLLAQGIRTALAYQRADGGIPFICDEDTWVTATAGLALHTAGADTPALDAIARRLLRLQHPDGGWSYSEHAHLTDADCTSAAVEVLRLTGPHSSRASIRRGCDALYALRGEDGGFPTYLAGAPSEACMTAAAANALSTQGPSQHLTLDAALDFLADRQLPDGSFPPDWSSSRQHTVFRATLAAARRPGTSAAERITRRAVHLVLNTQNSDGGWGRRDAAPSDALSTAYALITLSAAHEDPGPAARGAAYLLTQQRPDGSIASVSDSIGPRPFGFTVPVLTDAFTLLALGHLTRRLTAPSAAPRPRGPGPAPPAQRRPEPAMEVFNSRKEAAW
ncbi:prenyltransferase/squalene oxidase repeat-containing protein [Kitasatospora sp. NPDC058218]|uniref:prenyltransferase/squalene oxidase repeat-containing protein n=1 Tax=Kitasatospora sp. NPDC058218 TaxID=3346385 RepID=UPI0036D8D35F